METEQTTLDGLLNKRVVFEQPAEGYRVAVDTVLLAAAVPALGGDRILDLGCGAGGAMLCAACRMAGLKGLGLEIQKELVVICKRNIDRNAFASGLDVRQGNATTLPPELHGAFDHVLMNPPYHDEATHDVSPNVMKRKANATGGDLGEWIASAFKALKPSGTLALIHTARHRDEILKLLAEGFGDLEILPLLPKTNAAPKRLIFRARKSALFAAKECNALILHDKSGRFTKEAESILREGSALKFTVI
jgi:tRNA1(Val) A37 N6-methylase TrmN6